MTITIEEARKVLEDNGYILDTCWTIQDIKDRVESMYEDTLFTTFTDNDCVNIGNELIKYIDWNSGVSWITVDDVIEDYANKNQYQYYA
jgi:hypothetical protein